MEIDKARQDSIARDRARKAEHALMASGYLTDSGTDAEDKWTEDDMQEVLRMFLTDFFHLATSRGVLTITGKALDKALLGAGKNFHLEGGIFNTD